MKFLEGDSTRPYRRPRPLIVKLKMPLSSSSDFVDGSRATASEFLKDDDAVRDCVQERYLSSPRSHTLLTLIYMPLEKVCSSPSPVNPADETKSRESLLAGTRMSIVTKVVKRAIRTRMANVSSLKRERAPKNKCSAAISGRERDGKVFRSLPMLRTMRSTSHLVFTRKASVKASSLGGTFTGTNDQDKESPSFQVSRASRGRTRCISATTRGWRAGWGEERGRSRATSRWRSDDAQRQPRSPASCPPATTRSTSPSSAPGMSRPPA
ncbi:hypothetical protein GW17_00013210 [Ensete ventricosum]|nr:hypothetical protein GW17_00013210 [Ensete ventricosum]